MDKYMDSTLSPEVRAEDLLQKLSWEEKLAQVVGVLDMPEKPELMERFIVHGMGQVSTLNWRTFETLEEAAARQRAFQTRIMECSPHHIPAIFHMEGLCGAYLQGATSFPSGIGRASSFDPALEEQIGRIVGNQERCVGITNTLAPVLDISRDSRMGRQGETYGEDPTLAAAMGSAFTRGIQGHLTDGRRSDSVAKHFLGFHASQGGIHGAHAEISQRTLEEIYAKPFQAAISEANLRGIMPCYCCINGEPTSASKQLLTKLLRQDMGFDGVAVSDYSAVSNVYTTQGMSASLDEAGLRCMRAGMDVELPVPSAFNDALLERFRSGEADPAILDQAVYRVLCAKFRMGLFEHPFALNGEELKEAFSDDTDVTLQSARESLVLLKNDGILPIGKTAKKISLIGCHADNARHFFGGYTHLSMTEAVHAVANSMAGVGTSGTTAGKEMLRVPGTDIQSDETEEFDALLRLQKPDCKSLYAMLCQMLPDAQVRYAYGYAIAGDDTSHFQEALDAVKDADLVILTLGGKHGSCSVASMGEGVDSTDINLPYCQDEFIRQAAAFGKPMVGVHFNGRPISSDTADEYLNAIIEAWNPSECGAQAIAEVLTGAISPSGRLPVCVARSAGQLPVYYNHPNGSMWHQGESIGFANYVDMTHKPRYFFGHGLSYTTFSYGDLILDIQEVTPDGSVTATVSITNTGSCDGTEVVQLYATDANASMSRPVLELVGFARVELKRGETKHVSFCVEPSQLAFLDEDMRWRIEAGQIKLYAAASSDDLRSQASFQITNTAYTTARNRKFYSLGQIQ